MKIRLTKDELEQHPIFDKKCHTLVTDSKGEFFIVCEAANEVWRTDLRKQYVDGIPNIELLQQAVEEMNERYGVPVHKLFYEHKMKNKDWKFQYINIKCKIPGCGYRVNFRFNQDQNNRYVNIRYLTVISKRHSVNAHIKACEFE